MKKGIIITSIIALIAIITISFAVSFQRGSQPERDKGDSAEQTVNEHSDEAEDELPSQSSLEFPSGSSIYIMDQDAVEKIRKRGSHLSIISCCCFLKREQRMRKCSESLSL